MSTTDNNLNSDDSLGYSEERGFFGKVLDFTTATGALAVTQLRDIPIGISNAFRSEYEQIPTEAPVESIRAMAGENAASFYEANTSAVNVVAFAATSLIPGGVAVKGLQAGQAVLKTKLLAGGTLATDLGFMAGVATDITAETAAAARAAMIASDAGMINAASVRAGLHIAKQQFMEAAAFEAASIATLQATPLLSDMTWQDQVTNGLVGAAIGGGVGTLLGGFGLRKSLLEGQATTATIDNAFKPVLEIQASDGLRVAEALIKRNEIQAVNIADDLLPQFAGAATNDINRIQARYARAQDHAAATYTNEAISGLRKLGADDHLIDYLVKDAATASSEDIVYKLSQLAKIERVGADAEGSLARVLRKLELKNEQPLTVSRFLDTVTGKVSTDAPVTFGLGNLGKASIRGNTVNVGKEAVKVVINPKDNYDIMHKSTVEVAARDAYLFERVKTSDDLTKMLKGSDYSVYEHDRPLLDAIFRVAGKAATDVLANPITVRLEQGGTKELTTVTQLKDLLLEYKSMQGQRLLNYNEVNKRARIAAVKDRTSKQVDEATAAGKSPEHIDKLKALGLAHEAKILNGHNPKLEMQHIEAKLNSATLGGLVDAEHLVLNRVADLEQRFSRSNPFLLPTHYKLDYSIKDLAKVESDIAKLGNVNATRAEATLMVAAELSRNERTSATNFALGTLVEADKASIKDSLPSETSLLSAFERINPFTGTSGLLHASNPDYATLQSGLKFVGSVVNNLMNAARTKVGNTLNPVGHMLTTTPNVARAFSMLNSKLLGTSSKYTFDRGSMSMISKVEGEEPIDLAVSFRLNAEDTEKLADAIEAHINQNARNLLVRAKINNAMHGTADITAAKHSDVFHPMQPDTKYFAHVYLRDRHLDHGTHVDDFGDGTMIYANTADDLIRLQEQITTKFGNKFIVKTTSDIAEYKKAYAEFDYTKAITESSVRSELARAGLTGTVSPLTDPKRIVEHFINFHSNNSAALVRKSIKTQYASVFDGLQKASMQHTKYETATRSGTAFTKYLRDTIDPYQKMSNEAMDISNKGEHVWFDKVTGAVDNLVDSVYNKVIGLRTYKGDVTTDDLDEIAKQLDSAGLANAGTQSIKYTLEEYAAVNRTVVSGVASAAVSRLNAALSFTTLRSDFFNAFNNTIGHPIMYGTELNSMIRELATKNPDFGKLVQSELGLANGTKGAIFNPAKLYVQASKDIWSEEGKKLRELYSSLGFDIHIASMYADEVHNVGKAVANGNWDAVNLGATKLANMAREAPAKIEKWTGNKLAEQHTRLVSARTAHIIGEHAVKAGMLEADNLFPFINSFVSRVHGTYLASQRPALFQGTIGQSVGLFLTYQMNMMQQLTRYLSSSGGNKSVAYMAGMQSTIYGMNGMPAFNALNSYIVGEAAGNTGHKDIYSSVYQAAGTQAGDWLVYGLGSNLGGLISEDLKTNLYTRGDLNPRNATLIPTSLQDVPWFNGWTKFIGNLYNTASATTEASSGAEFASVLARGLEHNGLSRPLAGLGRFLEGYTNPQGMAYSTTGNDQIIAAWDMYSLPSIVQGLGAKSLVEARTMDAAYRLKGYEATDSEKVQKITASMRTKFQAGIFDRTEFDELQAEYLKLGHTVGQWNTKFMDLAKHANDSVVDKLVTANSSKASQQLQYFMGGSEASVQAVGIDRLAKTLSSEQVQTQ